MPSNSKKLGEILTTRMCSASIAVRFLHRLNTSKAAQRRISRIRRIHAGFEVVRNLHFQVKPDFVIQLALQPFAYAEAAQPRGKYTRPAHPSSSRKRSMVDDIRLQSSVSLASRFR